MADEQVVAPDREQLIIRKMLKHMIANQDTKLKPGSLHRELGNASKVLGIPRNELRTVFEKILKEIVEEALSPRE